MRADARAKAEDGNSGSCSEPPSGSIYDGTLTQSTVETCPGRSCTGSSLDRVVGLSSLVGDVETGPYFPHVVGPDNRAEAAAGV